jgi:hypothetical protein
VNGLEGEQLTIVAYLASEGGEESVRKLLAAIVLVAGLMVFPALGGFAASDTTVVVTPANMQGWAFMDDNENGGVGQMVSGPETPPLGSGSAELGVSTNNQGYVLATAAYNGTKLSDITNLGYSSYQPGPTLAIALQFDVKFTPDAVGYQGRLVFEPYQNGDAVVGSGWQSWSPLDGMWWSSHDVDGKCPQASPCTWANVMNYWSDATIAGGTLFKAGGNWASFDGNVDAFTIGIDGVNTTYDFEPAITPTTKDQCKKGGWQQFNAPFFKNQGDCIQFVNTGK